MANLEDLLKKVKNQTTCNSDNPNVKTPLRPNNTKKGFEDIIRKSLPEEIGKHRKGGLASKLKTTNYVPPIQRPWDDDPEYQQIKAEDAEASYSSVQSRKKFGAKPVRITDPSQIPTVIISESHSDKLINELMEEVNSLKKRIELLEFRILKNKNDSES